MIHVAYRLWGGDGFYAKMLGTSMLSMFENTKEKVTVHIMHNDRLTPDNRGKFCYIAGQYNQQVDFRNVEEMAGPSLRKFEAAHPIKSGINASWYPLIIHEIFPDLDKLIFLGADTVINLDIGELWSYDLNNVGGVYGFGAVPEAYSKSPKSWIKIVVDNLVDYNDYFNADVLLIKPSFFKENFEAILDGCKFIHDNNYNLYEQDALNYLFSKKYMKLPGKFNSMLMGMRVLTPKPHHLEKRIYHFSGHERPYLDTDDVFNRLYFEYFLKTPWANVDMFGNLDKAVNKTLRNFNNEAKGALLHFTNLLAERKRAFFVDSKFIETTKQTFAIKNDELVIDSASGGEKFLMELKNLRGKVIFFLFIDNYLQARAFLLSQGFVEGTDFINGFMFLSEQHGLTFNFDSKPVVQEM